MEKATFKAVVSSKKYKEGVESFKKRNSKTPSQNFGWYKTKVSSKKWNEYHSKLNYSFLDQDGDDFVWIGFLASEPPEGCLEITNIEELRKLDLSRRAKNLLPFVFEDVKK